MGIFSYFKKLFRLEAIKISYSITVEAHFRCYCSLLRAVVWKLKSTGFKNYNKMLAASRNQQKVWCLKPTFHSMSWLGYQWCSCPARSHNYETCQNSSMVSFLEIDPMISGSNPPSARLSLRVGRFAMSLGFKAYESRGWVASRGRTWTLLDKEISFQCPHVCLWHRGRIIYR